jgi:hypothetical protein
MDMLGVFYGLLSIQVETFVYPTVKMPKNGQYGDATDKIEMTAGDNHKIHTDIYINATYGSWNCRQIIHSI